MFLTLKAMPGHLWELCQVRVSHKSGGCVRQKWRWIHSVHEMALAPFNDTAYSSVPSNGGKRVVLTIDASAGCLSDTWFFFPHLHLGLIITEFSLSSDSKNQ